MARQVPIRVVVVLMAVGLVGCGGSGTREVVAQVGGSAITRPAVSHWMAVLAGDDYFDLSRNETIPAGLVSDPPSYSRCISSLQAAIPGAGGAGSAPNELLSKCREMNLALRMQAANFLVQAQWLTEVERDQGIIVTEPEVQKLFKRIRAERYPTQAALQAYLTSRRWGLPDLLFHVRLDVLGQKAQSKLASGGKQAASFNAAERRWRAKTSCSKGYIVELCKQYKGADIYTGSASPAVLMEQIAALITGRCINLPACGKP